MLHGRKVCMTPVFVHILSLTEHQHISVVVNSMIEVHNPHYINTIL